MLIVFYYIGINYKHFWLFKYNILKGDGYIKNITIKVIGTGIKDIYQAKVKIYDYNNIYYVGITYNGEIDLSLEENKAYIIYIELNNNIINNTFYVTNQKKYYFYLNYSIYYSKHAITFLLKDSNYNIPIMKGVIILGKNN